MVNKTLNFPLINKTAKEESTMEGTCAQPKISYETDRRDEIIDRLRRELADLQKINAGLVRDLAESQLLERMRDRENQALRGKVNVLEAELRKVS